MTSLHWGLVITGGFSLTLAIVMAVLSWRTHRNLVADTAAVALLCAVLPLHAMMPRGTTRVFVECLLFLAAAGLLALGRRYYRRDRYTVLGERKP